MEARLFQLNNACKLKWILVQAEKKKLKSTVSKIWKHVNCPLTNAPCTISMYYFIKYEKSTEIALAAKYKEGYLTKEFILLCSSCLEGMPYQQRYQTVELIMHPRMGHLENIPHSPQDMGQQFPITSMSLVAVDISQLWRMLGHPSMR